jgi:hypothetical protein
VDFIRLITKTGVPIQPSKRVPYIDRSHLRKKIFFSTILKAWLEDHSSIQLKFKLEIGVMLIVPDHLFILIFTVCILAQLGSSQLTHFSVFLLYFICIFHYFFPSNQEYERSFLLTLFFFFTEFNYKIIIINK